MAALSVEEKKTRGAAINVAKQAIEAALNARRQAAGRRGTRHRSCKAEALDVSLPGRLREPGGLHPVSLTMERIEQIFASMGFDVADGPEIESDWHSFTSLNNPPNHPARSMQDTFYVDINGEDGIPYNLRPHTSPMQVRYAHAHIKKYAERGEARRHDARDPRDRARAAPTAWTATPPIRPCSTSAKACGWART